MKKSRSILQYIRDKDKCIYFVASIYAFCPNLWEKAIHDNAVNNCPVF